MKFQALSILKPAVINILDGKKVFEIRSWTPPTIPLYNVVLVQNEKYLVSPEDEDDGLAMAIVDFTSVSPWTKEIFLKQKISTTMNKHWMPGYFLWRIENVRKIDKPKLCRAKKGIYFLDLELN
ncbi:hypothetical protein QZP90_09290 [Serratia marcescens]|uniref:hypothetical protein n=1 Tax=Serratia TaxID=613 RepID=UPI0013DB2803|nr:hypothetical protein [Serratia marcescens]MDP8599483.1 hypothetical protein [Serratia marcescens]MDP8684183.1 hypothetical protein [Serratia marcescens]MDP8733709.1 hypothetical protein [Serratia marcescens]MDP8793080.1 hypothetical protein [Serratia marcescens]HEJ7833432.1 hypothetical protein [Serratia marcescens]